MLLRFRVTNFASIRDEQELSLVELDEHAGLATTPVPTGRERVLPSVGIFGANASGKSAVVRAMDFGRSVVVESHQSWLPEQRIPRWPFRLDAASRVAPSVFVFDFLLDAVRYEYGFRLDDTAIIEEWLYSWPRGKRTTLFERAAMEIDFGPSLTGQKATIAELVRENSLFLSAAAANNHPRLRPIAAWFASWRRAPAGDHSAPREMLDESVLALLRFADVGVVGARLTESATDDSPPPDGLWDRADTGRAFDDDSSALASSLRSLFSRRFTLLGNTVELVHEAGQSTESLPWSWESSGTQTWVWLAQAAVSSLNEGTIFVVDDLGSTLHPLLTTQLVGLFQRPETNRHGAQLIFTGHDVNLLGPDVEHRLHRDQVWLTSKGRDGTTKLFPLTEYGRVRDGLDNVERRYLQGRYGAVPFFDPSLIEGLTVEGDERGAR